MKYRHAIALANTTGAAVILLSTTAGAQVQTFRSDETWLADGSGSNTRAMPVCLSPSVPSICPKTGPVLLYNSPGQAWELPGLAASGAKWIWDAREIAKNDTAGNDQFITEKEFFLNCDQVTGLLAIAADNYAEVRVNGTLVGSIGSVVDPSIIAHDHLTTFDISSVLAGGGALNTIEITAINAPGGCPDCDYSSNPAGVVFVGYLACSSPVSFSTSDLLERPPVDRIDGETCIPWQEPSGSPATTDLLCF